MKKLFYGLIVLCLVLTTGCTPKNEDPKPTNDPNKNVNSDDELVVYGIYKAGDQTWFLDEGEAAKKVIEAAGGRFVYVDAKMDPQTYMNAIDNAIADNADGILTCIPDQTLSQSVMDKVEDAGIPIVAADDALQDADGNKLAPWVGIDSYALGLANGEWIGNYMTEMNYVDDPEVGVLFLTMETVSSCVPRTQGEKDAFYKLHPNFDKSRVFEADTDGTTDKGNTQTATIITGNPQITKWVVMPANEESVVGSLRAIETAGLAEGSAVIGVGAYLAKDEWNSVGSDTAFAAATYFSSDAVGGTSAQVLLDIIDGKNVEQETAAPSEVVTFETYKEVMGEAAN